jgi:hypothetical protein
MSTPEEDLQKAAAASFRAWGTVMSASISAFSTMFNTVLEWAGDERSEAPANHTKVDVYSDHDCTLKAEFYWDQDPTKTLVAPGVVVLAPDSLKAMKPGETVEVDVSVPAVAHVKAGGYKGRIVDEHGVELEAKIFVPAPVPGSG